MATRTMATRTMATEIYPQDLASEIDLDSRKTSILESIPR